MITDLNLKNWKDYQDIITDSLWLIGERDKSGAHKGDYHGNFIPQTPNQLMRRFTKKGRCCFGHLFGKRNYID